MARIAQRRIVQDIDLLAALECADKIKNDSHGIKRSVAFLRTANVLVEFDDFETAIEVLNGGSVELETISLNSEVMDKIEQKLLAMQDLQLAYRLAGKLDKNSFDRAYIILKIALGSNDANGIKAAIAAIKEINNDTAKESACELCIDLLLNKEKNEVALELARALQGMKRRLNFLKIIFKIADPKILMRIFKEVKDSSKAIWQSEQHDSLSAWDYERSHVYEAISTQLAHLHCFDDARSIIKSIKYVGCRSGCFRALAVGLAETGEFEEALRVIAKVEASREAAILELIEVIAKAHQFEKALSLLKGLDKYFSDRARNLIAIQMAEAKDFFSARELAQAIEDIEIRCQAYLGIYSVKRKCAEQR